MKSRRWCRAILLATALLVVAIACADSAVAGPPSAGSAHASIGFEPTPLSLATDAAGHVYLSNPTTSRRVQEYSSEGRLLARLGRFATSGGFETRALATDPEGDLWVADGVAGKTVELGGDGMVLRSWRARGLGVAIDGTGDVYLVEGSTVARYSAGGTLISKWDLPTGASESWGIAVGPDGLIYVADTYGDRVEVFEADGTPVRSWSTEETEEPELPYGIAVAQDGDVYLADTEGDRVEEFSATGAFLRSWGGHGNKPGRFDTPTAIAVGPEGDVYVADEAAEYPGPGTARVQKFSAEGQFVTEWGYVPRPPPDPPRLIKAPPKKTSRDTAVFAFSSREEGATFLCRLAGHSVPEPLQTFRRCSSPQRYAHLRPGRKVFEVFAVVGRTEGRVTRRAWTVLAPS